MRIAACNGLDARAFKAEVLDVNGVGHEVEMVPAIADADIVVFGPYGADVPPVGPYLRVAYICENFVYDGPACDFVFRVPHANASGLPSARVQWHGVDPARLVKSASHDAEAIYREKDRFCLFLYSNRVPYREMLFEALSKYRRVDAPGLSMTNHPSIDADAQPGETRWETKRRFMRRYKFTLAFENEIFRGYQTEKLYDAMLSDSIPVYIGDPDVGTVFDDRSFLNITKGEAGFWVSRLEDFAQLRWFEVVGPRRRALDVRVTRKLRRLARDARHLYFARKISSALVDQIVVLDRSPDAYLAMHRMPWLKDNRVPEASYSAAVWRGLFARAQEKRRQRRAVAA